MRGRPLLHDFFLQSYKRQKSEKNFKIHQKTAKNSLKTLIFHFSDAYNFIRKHRGELGDPSFCSEFFPLSDDYIFKCFSQVPL